MPYVQSLALNQVVPSVFDAAASLLLVFIIFYIFKVTNPRTRYTFLVIVMVRSFIVLIDNAYATVHVKRAGLPLFFGVRLPDPLNMLSLKDTGSCYLTYSNSALMIAITVAFYGVGVFIVLRWVQLIVFLTRLKNEAELNRASFSKVYDKLDVIANNLNVKRPHLVQTDKFPIVPFSIGFLKPTIVISHKLIEKFTDEQLEIMLAHEMAHIKRGDYVNGWLMMILRDVMFFNPLAHLIYRLSEEEKESSCDREAMRLVNIAPKKLADTLVDVALFYKTEQLKTARISQSITKGFLYRKSTLDRRIASILAALSNIPRSRTNGTVRLAGKYIAYFLVLLLQIAFTLKIGGYLIILR